MNLIILSTITAIIYVAHLFYQDKIKKEKEELRKKEFDLHWDSYFKKGGKV